MSTESTTSAARGAAALPACVHGSCWTVPVCSVCHSRVVWTPEHYVTCPRAHLRLYYPTASWRGVFVPTDADTGETLWPAPGMLFNGHADDLVVSDQPEIVDVCRKCIRVEG